MYRILIPLLVAGWLPTGAQAQQQWKTLEQMPLGLRYEVPREWYVGGIMDAKKCHCSSGTLNSSFRDHINMVVFASDKFSLDSLKRQSVWGYSFVETLPKQEIPTKIFLFEQTVSRWREDNELNVIRLTATYQGVHYLLYFWGESEMLLRQNPVIERIIQSINPM